MVKFRTILKARYLRKEKTRTEEILWLELRNNKLGVKFRRQHPIDIFVVDFYAPSIGLAIELDGALHKDNKEYDRERTNYLNSKNIQVLRFWNSEIEQDLERVLSKIRGEIKSLPV